MVSSERERHRALAARKKFTCPCEWRVFSAEELALIRRRGHWYRGLSEGTLTPLTEAQLTFVAAVHGEQKPEEPHAAAWWKVLHRLKLEQEHGPAMHSAYQIDADTFFNRDMVKHVRRTMGGVNLRENKRGDRVLRSADGHVPGDPCAGEVVRRNAKTYAAVRHPWHRMPPSTDGSAPVNTCG